MTKSPRPKGAPESSTLTQNFMQLLCSLKQARFDVEQDRVRLSETGQIVSYGRARLRKAEGNCAEVEPRVIFLVKYAKTS